MGAAAISGAAISGAAMSGAGAGVSADTSASGILPTGTDTGAEYAGRRIGSAGFAPPTRMLFLMSFRIFRPIASISTGSEMPLEFNHPRYLVFTFAAVFDGDGDVAI
jgi:hypothetical protein